MKCINCGEKKRVSELAGRLLGSEDRWCLECRDREEKRSIQEDRVGRAIYSRLPRYMLDHSQWKAHGYEEAK